MRGLLSKQPESMSQILQQLAQVLDERRGADPESSYVASLHHKGLEKILKKIGEEATEVVIAGAQQDKGEIVYEVADLWFHTMILLSQQGLGPDDVLNELARRFGVSGHDEKASRTEK